MIKHLGRQSLEQDARTIRAMIFSGLLIQSGDGTYYLLDNARVLQHIEFTPRSWRLVAGSASDASLGDYAGFTFNIGDSMAVVWKVPKNADLHEDFTVRLYWAIDEAYGTGSGEVQWSCAFSAVPADESEALDAPGYTGDLDPGDQSIPATAKYATYTDLGNLDGHSLDGEEIVALEIKRVALDGGSDPTADPLAFLLTIEYTMNKFGLGSGPSAPARLLESGEYLLTEAAGFRLLE